MSNIFEKILYGIKVANDNIITLNAKLDKILESSTVEDRETKEETDSPE